jgi:hypothetical protein
MRDHALDGGSVWRKLTWEQAEWVRANAKTFSKTDMARRLGVTRAVVRNIINNKTYKHKPVETEKA